MWLHKHSNWGNCGIGQRIQKEHDDKNLLPQINPLTQIDEEIKSPVCSDDSTRIPLKLAGILTFTIQDYFRRSRTESLKYKVAYISSPIYTNRLIYNLASRYFSSCSIMICQPISYSFKNLVSVTSSLLFSIVLIEELQSRAENGEETLWIFPRIWRSLLAAKLHRRKNNSASYAGYYYISLSI